jgi:hypothetical protein
MGAPSGSPLNAIIPLIAWMLPSKAGAWLSGPDCPNPEIEQ